MTIELTIKSELKDKGMDSWKRGFYKVILGEFNRVNDGKPIDNDKCLSVIKKLIKNAREVLVVRPGESTKREIDLLESFLSLSNNAPEAIIRVTINSVLSNGTFKNKMQAMKPCIEKLTAMGYNVDKALLADLLKG